MSGRTQSAWSDHVLGIDGCPGGGWVVVVISRDGRATVEHASSAGALARRCEAAALALIDIPIGLVDGPRLCDVEARAIVGPRRSSVFPAPPRWLLECRTVQEADKAMAARGRRKVQRQLWNIVARIRDIDDVLRSGALPAGRLRECHPEVCFRVLAGEPLRHSKHTREGLALRRAILERRWAGAGDIVDAAMQADSPWKEDDVLDAFAAALTAAGVWTCGLTTLPEDPPRDACGLPMEMVMLASATALRASAAPA